MGGKKGDSMEKKETQWIFRLEIELDQISEENSYEMLWGVCLII